jgi:type 1 fimbriae regulatory protein FimB
MPHLRVAHRAAWIPTHRDQAMKVAPPRQSRLANSRHFAHTTESRGMVATVSVGVQWMRRSASNAKKPKVQDRKYLRPDEARRLIEVAGRRGRYPFRDKVLVRLVYRHGLRASEAVGMRWSHVDLEQGVIHIARVKGSNDSTHSLDRDELRDLRKLRQQVTGLYVFETERGGAPSVDALQYIVREAGRAARLDAEVHPHMLRHAAGYALANEGVDTRLIQDFLGHADIRHTAHYTALSPRRLAAVRVR